MDAHVSLERDGRRVEDARLITGTGKYAADWNAPHQLYAHFVRADRAHAEILSINTAALAAPGVKHALSLIADGKFGSTFRNGCHIAEVEVDPDTGETEVVSYCAVDDCGVVINHAIKQFPEERA